MSQSQRTLVQTPTGLPHLHVAVTFILDDCSKGTLLLIHVVLFLFVENGISCQWGTIPFSVLQLENIYWHRKVVLTCFNTNPTFCWLWEKCLKGMNESQQVYGDVYFLWWLTSYVMNPFSWGILNSYSTLLLIIIVLMFWLCYRNLACIANWVYKSLCYCLSHQTITTLTKVAIYMYSIT